MSGIAPDYRSFLRSRTPAVALRGLRKLRTSIGDYCQRTVITEPIGRLPPSSKEPCALLVVGSRFDQRKPDAMMTCRMGYANAFERLGIPYLICDWREVEEAVEKWPHAFSIVFGSDVSEMSATARRTLAQIPTAVWVNPWFKGEADFFSDHGLQGNTWIWSAGHRKAVLDLGAKFGFTATVPSGLDRFESWRVAGLEVVSLPLACDTSLYHPMDAEDPAFAEVDLAFVGGYWESKGKALDRYLRPFEDQLTVYGYNRWPYRGYSGSLERERESALYRQAKICPVVNEPTVALMKGQINERIFKVLGAGGTPVVDAVPAYRELFSDEELGIPEDETEFAIMVRELLADSERRHEVSKRGRAAVLERHTYIHRARTVLAGLKINAQVESASEEGRIC